MRDVIIKIGFWANAYAVISEDPFKMQGGGARFIAAGLSECLYLRMEKPKKA